MRGGVSNGCRYCGKQLGSWTLAIRVAPPATAKQNFASDSSAAVKISIRSVSATMFESSSRRILRPDTNRCGVHQVSLQQVRAQRFLRGNQAQGAIGRNGQSL